MASMTTERVVEIPWALQALPHRGRILDVGSCEATYLESLVNPGRELHCLDPRDCRSDLPPEARFHHQSLLGNDIPASSFDAVLVLSTLEHIGLPSYEQPAFPHGDVLALAEIARLLVPGGRAVLTVPVGQSKAASWYRQYSAEDLDRLLDGWIHEVTFWGYDGQAYRRIGRDELDQYDYRDRHDREAGAGAVAGIIGWRI
jgi:SAM-dependent methyltransferase